MNQDVQTGDSEKIILLVEDNPSDVELTRRAFGKHHIANKLVVLEDGQEALDYLLGTEEAPGCADSGKLPTIILLDLKLPVVGGMDVLKRIKSDSRTKRVPVVILTTSKEEQDLAESYNNGANSYIRKPVDFAQFAETVRQLGLYWLVLNEPPPKSK